ncbi:MAG TPA: hypothetical protein VKG26_14570 [Bacteroidia bacterium]|nr:hypothetical protein [Bacteroidia bacterium]
MDRQTNFTSKDFFRLIMPWRKSILVFCGLSTLCAIIFSSPTFISPLFKSELILYPPATNSNKELLEYDMRFGADKEIDEQLQIFRSGILRDSIIKKYALMSHYKINTADKYSNDNLYRKFDDRISFDRTRYNAIAITVYDASADTAAMIANDIAVFGDKVKENIFKHNYKVAYEILEKQFLWTKGELDSIKSRILLFGKISEKLNDKTEREQFIHKAKKEQDIPMLTLLTNYENKLVEFADIEKRYYEAKEKLFNKFPTSYIITPATVSSKKAYPSRGFIVLVTFMCSLLLATALVFVIERLKSIGHTVSDK